MKAWVKTVIIALVIGLPAFFLGPILWPPNESVQPGNLLAFFMLLSLIEALLFGLGIAFIIFGWKFVKKSSQANRDRVIAMYFAISWFLVSWWPHDNFHIHVALDPLGLLLIEYGFHLTLIIAALVIAYSFYGILKEGRL